MRILYIPDTVSQYGATNSLKEMTNTLKEKHGVEPIIAINKNNPLYNEFIKMGFEVHDSKHVAFMIGHGRTWWKKIIKNILIPYYYVNYKVRNYLSIKKLEEEIDFSKIDFIHTNVNRNDLGAILARRNNVKHIWHLREFGKEDYDCFSLRRNYIDFMNKNTTKFIAISKAVAECWIKNGLDKNKVETVYNGVNTEKFQKDLTIKKNDKIRLVMSGFIFEGKGQLELIRALKALPQKYLEKIELDLYGDANREYLIKIKKEIKGTILQNKVFLKGYCKNINSELPKYDIGVVCSKSEGFGRVTIEYMMSGLCVIASNTGANPELVKNEKNGLLYEYGNINDLRDKICYLIDNKDKFNKMRDAGYNYSKKKFNNFKNAEYVFSIYKLSSKGSKNYE